MSISFIVTQSGTINAVVKGKAYSVAIDHPSYNDIKQALLDGDEDKFTVLTDIPQSVEDFALGNVEIKNGVVNYKGQEIHNTITKRILAMMRMRFPFEPMLRFLENMMDNPSKRAVDELYSFLDNRHLPITEDGCFLAYKSVSSDFKDWWTRAIDNSVGATPEMPRNQVDDDRESHCSDGLHVGAMEYVGGYHGDQGHTIIVKVNPKDAVSVPNDEQFTKMRVCKYEVVSIYEGDLTKVLYTEDGTPVTVGGRTDDNPFDEGPSPWSDGKWYDDDEDGEDGEDGSWSWN